MPDEHLGLVAPEHRQARVVEQPDLREERRVVPVDVLVRDEALLEPDDRDVWEHDATSGRSHAGQPPVHRQRVGEGHDELVDHAVVADGA